VVGTDRATPRLRRKMGRLRGQGRSPYTPRVPPCTSLTDGVAGKSHALTAGPFDIGGGVGGVAMTTLSPFPPPPSLTLCKGSPRAAEGSSAIYCGQRGRTSTLGTDGVNFAHRLCTLHLCYSGGSWGASRICQPTSTHTTGDSPTAASRRFKRHSV